MVKTFYANTSMMYVLAIKFKARPITSTIQRNTRKVEILTHVSLKFEYRCSWK